MKVCKRCGENKPHSEYYTHQRTADGLQAWCKRCQAERRNENAKAKRVADPEQAEKEAAWMREHVSAATSEIRSLLGSVCVECGTTENLDIDHVLNDGEEHRAEFGGSGLTYYRAVLAEIQAGSDRFQLLCKSHHGRKTRVCAAA